MRALAGLITAAAIAGCAPAPTHPGGVCGDDPNCMAGVDPGGGGGTGGHRDAATDAATDGAADVVSDITTVTVHGALVVTPTLPVVFGMSPFAPAPPGAGWVVQNADLANAPMITPGDAGAFTLTSVAVTGGTYRIRATPPQSMGFLDTLAEFSPLNAIENDNVIAIPESVLQSAATTGSVTIDPSSGQLVVQLLGATAVIQGVSFAITDTMARPVGANVLYDNDTTGQFNSPRGVTGMLGTILALNIPTTPAGAVYNFTLTRGLSHAAYHVTSRATHVTYVLVSAP